MRVKELHNGYNKKKAMKDLFGARGGEAVSGLCLRMNVLKNN